MDFNSVELRAKREQHWEEMFKKYSAPEFNADDLPSRKIADDLDWATASSESEYTGDESDADDTDVGSIDEATQRQLYDIPEEIFMNTFSLTISKHTDAWNKRRERCYEKETTTKDKTTKRRNTIIDNESRNSDNMNITLIGGDGKSLQMDALTKQLVEGDYHKTPVKYGQNNGSKNYDRECSGNGNGKKSKEKSINMIHNRNENWEKSRETADDMMVQKKDGKLKSRRRSTCERKTHNVQETVMKSKNRKSLKGVNDTNKKDLINISSDDESDIEIEEVVKKTTTTTTVEFIEHVVIKNKKHPAIKNGGKNGTRSSERDVEINNGIGSDSSLSDSGMSPRKRSKNTSILNKDQDVRLTIVLTSQKSGKCLVKEETLKKQVFANIPKEERHLVDTTQIGDVEVDENVKLFIQTPISKKNRSLAITNTPNQYDEEEDIISRANVRSKIAQKTMIIGIVD